jgi:hypothetical protein
VAYHVKAADATYGANQTTRMAYRYGGFRIAPSYLGLEHPRPHALGNHCLSGSSAGEPATTEKVKTILEKHPWYANQWQGRLQDAPAGDRGLVLFMQAARWPDELRIIDRQYYRGPWHYINWPFKPEGQPPSVQTREPEAVNILTALAENERVVTKENDPERKAIALAWLFHLVGDIHQPLHTAQLFTVEYPQGDRGGNEICVRVTQTGQPMDLHRFWDGVITSSSNLTRLRNEATPKSPGVSAGEARGRKTQNLHVGKSDRVLSAFP